MKVLGMGVTPPIYQLHIALVALDPPVWRRIWIDSSTSLTKLNRIIQIAMGWTGGFDHEFEIAGVRYGAVVRGGQTDTGLLDERRQAIGSLIGPDPGSFAYRYDLLSHWLHIVQVERILLPNHTNDWTQCVEGANACPPPRVGNAGGYREFLLAISDPAHEHHVAMRRWYGGPFCPFGFDVNSVNREFRRLQL